MKESGAGNSVVTKPTASFEALAVLRRYLLLTLALVWIGTGAQTMRGQGFIFFPDVTSPTNFFPGNYVLTNTLSPVNLDPILGWYINPGDFSVTNGGAQGFIDWNTSSWSPTNFSGIQIITFDPGSYTNSIAYWPPNSFPDPGVWPGNYPQPPQPSTSLTFVTPLPERGAVGVPIEMEVMSQNSTDVLSSVEFSFAKSFVLPDAQSPIAGAVFQSGIFYPVLTGVTSLGVVSVPPFKMTWVPADCGSYLVWARATNQAGQILEMPNSSTIVIYAANDDFARATELNPETVSVNLPFNTQWTSVETNEPLRSGSAALHTLWWKWTPDHAATMRFKAVRNRYGLPLEIFTGSDLANLRRIAHNDRLVSITGKSGIVQLKVRAAQTYFIRVSEDSVTHAMPPARVGAAADAMLTIEPASTPLPGELRFSLVSSAFVRNGHLTIRPLCRVFESDRRTPLTGSQYKAQLYVGGKRSSLQPVGSPQPFFDESVLTGTPSLAGTFNPDVVLVPWTTPGRLVFAQIRVWDSRYGETFEMAARLGSPTAQSETIPVIAGSEKTAPAPLRGLKDFGLVRRRR